MNEELFNGKGQVYSASRPGYPAPLFSYLKKRGILTKQTAAADIGSGTGIFSAGLLPFVKVVYAVEPNAEMRAELQQRFESESRVALINGSAENTGLKEKSVGCITAAQSFHWFDQNAFQAECRRILKPGGHVVLVWNDRDQSQELIRKNGELNARFCPKYKGFSAGMDFSVPGLFSDFFCGNYEVRLFENPVFYSLGAFLGRNLSSSFAPQKGEGGYEEYTAALSGLFQEFCHGGGVLYPYITRCCIGTV